ncbi:uncharacterized protein LOC111614988 isoform X2 [Centruroides sculpturatus]|uniref:uncharacterized protein LOC111614988 isoform X2 n=1 Tax=Centruroides sculpturatus TaxID=218467 RepID=UPI000C6E59CE|nr:uncharacterized protein LOC111614988 isoform X2 [Centruroides sculpturatus]
MYPSINWNFIIESLKYYRQRDGIAMGSVIGPKLADICMTSLDEKIFQFQCIVFYTRYVDDILILYDSNDITAENIKNYANSLNNNIKFTYEEERNYEINYLDVIITRQNETLLFRKYEKICNNNKVIKYKSYCPIGIKRNVFLMELKKIFNRTTLKKYIEIETKNLFKKYLLNDYPQQLIHRWYITYINNRYNVKNRKIENLYIKIPYISKFYEKYKIYIKELFFVNLVGEQRNKLNKSICLINKANEIQLKNPLEVAGVVYELMCTCTEWKYYIGETGRKLEVRLKEHEAAIRLNRTESPWQQHCSITNCIIDRNNIKILYKVKNLVKRRIIEHYCIKGHVNCINLNTGACVNACWDSLIEYKSTGNVTM